LLDRSPQAFTGTNTFAGRVGIGTTSPQASLHVVGPIIANGDVRPTGITMPGSFGADETYVGTAGNYIAFSHAGVSEDFIGYKNNTFYMKDSPGGGDTVDPNLVVGGNVGIGTNAPAAKLHVIGNMLASGNVGIGTTAPRNQLDVVGNTPSVGGVMTIQNENADGFSGIYFNASDGTRMGWVGWANANASLIGPGTMQIGAGNAFVKLKPSTGSVGIGAAVDPVYQLQLGQDSAGKPGGGSWANSSDRRIKQNIRPMEGALERLTRLRGVTFEWRNPEDHANQQGTQAGFIAQEVAAVFPNWVTEVDAAEHDRALTDDGKIKSLTLPFEFDAVVVEAIKEQQAEIAELRQQVRELKTKDAERDAKLAAIEEMLRSAAPPSAHAAAFQAAK